MWATTGLSRAVLADELDADGFKDTAGINSLFKNSFRNLTPRPFREALASAVEKSRAAIQRTEIDAEQFSTKLEDIVLRFYLLPKSFTGRLSGGKWPPGSSIQTTVIAARSA